MNETKNMVSMRHRQEWEDFRKEFLTPAMAGADSDLAKAAKAIADVLKVYQEGERKAWGFSDEEDDGALEIAWAEQ